MSTTDKLVAPVDLEVRRILLPPYNNNCYVVVCPETGESIIVDAPSNPDQILALAGGTQLRLVVITHKHRDHWGALQALWERTHTEVAAHPLDAPDLPVPAQRQLQEGDAVEFGKSGLRVLHTPGHTGGSICLVSGRHLISGDTLFPNGPGRTQTPRDLGQIIESITGKLFALPDDTIVYPGHGEGTVLGLEKDRFARFASRPRDPALCGDVTWVAEP